MSVPSAEATPTAKRVSALAVFGIVAALSTPLTMGLGLLVAVVVAVVLAVRGEGRQAGYVLFAVLAGLLLSALWNYVPAGQSVTVQD